MKEIISKSNSFNEVSMQYYGYANTKTYLKIKKFIKENNINIAHFPKNAANLKRTKYKKIKKICPICEKEFETRLGSPKEKIVCSHACANTYFRSGEKNPNYKKDENLTGIIKYVKICFRYHEKKCVYCEEKNIVEVHHYDGNKKNDLPENLIPLCPTHHRYWHSRFRYIVKTKVDKYVVEFKQKIGM